MIRAAGHRVTRHSVDDPAWHGALDASVDLVVAAGGDGTVATVLCEAATRRGSLVTVLPIGSANNIAHVLGLAGRAPEELVAAWGGWTRRGYRLGRVAGPNRQELFVET